MPPEMITNVIPSAVISKKALSRNKLVTTLTLAKPSNCIEPIKNITSSKEAVIHRGIKRLAIIFCLQPWRC